MTIKHLSIMKINLFQILPYKEGLREADKLYCSGIDCISSCLSVLYAKGYRDFQINFLGEIDCLVDVYK